MSSDKENASSTLDMPKKRVKTAAAPAKQAVARTVSRKVESQVLSPRSHNSRAPLQAHSPLRTSPPKSFLARPISPRKTLPSTASTAATGLAASKSKPAAGYASTKRPKMPALPTGSVRRRPGAVAAAPAQAAKSVRGRPASRSSNTSDTSAGTTIVKKRVAEKKGIVGKMASLASSAGKKAATMKRDAVAMAPASSAGRVLRTRK